LQIIEIYFLGKNKFFFFLYIKTSYKMSQNKNMSYFVKKRSGKNERVHLDKITSRIERLCYGLDMNYIDPITLTMKVIKDLYSGISTAELDTLASEICAVKGSEHPDFLVLAARIFVSNLHKETSKEFSEVMDNLYNNMNNGKHTPIINERVHNVVKNNKDAINSMLIYDRDYSLSFFGLKTLEKAYLLRMNDKIVERPQHLLMRVSVAIHGDNLEKVQETYESMSNKYFIHATPTLFNAGTEREGLSSCFLIALSEEQDSIEGIYDVLKEAAIISKYSGGIGISIHDIRAKGSLIHSTNGKSEGIIPMLGVFNKSAAYVTQASKRPGSIAIYLEPWHAEIEGFLKLKEATGTEEFRARDLFYALWINDLFMKRVKNDEMWSLMCPNECPGLSTIYGDEFEELYQSYEKEGRYRKQIKATDLFYEIMQSQIRSGVPYMCYKDHANRKNNQANLGTIRSSNLCAEIMEYTDKDETAVCNLASIGLPAYISSSNEFDHNLLNEKVKIVTRNLDKVIDITHYPVSKTRVSNLRHRPIGLGVSGLADVFTRLGYAFDSPEAKQLNKDIFETIYFAALTASNEMAQESGKYDSYEGSGFSKGKFQWDLWEDAHGNKKIQHSGRWDWETLRASMLKHGMRNSLLTATMPTASSAHILGNSECIEPLNSHIYKRQTLSGEFQLVNQYLLKKLCEMGLWNESLKNKIIQERGSIRNIMEIPQEIRDLFKVAWDIPQKVLIELSADRGPYIDQSQSLNIFYEEPSFEKLSKMHMYGWEKGLKTGMYYLRQRVAVSAIQFSVDPQHQSDKKKEEEVLYCTRDNTECEACSA
jgi:ribonucleoside-diphosphate reductase alpha subunit